MKYIKASILFALSFLLTLVIIELYMWAGGIMETSPNEMYQDIGRGRRRDHSFIRFREGFTISRYNDYGYRGPDYRPEKGEGIFRIALMGDSYIEAYQVFDRHHFGAIMEKALNKDLPKGEIRKIEVLNFGHGGFNLSDNYAFQKVYVDRFHPDLYLYFINDDDLMDYYMDNLMPRAVMQGDSLVISRDYPEASIRRFMLTKPLIQNSVLMNMFNLVYKKAKTPEALSIVFEKFAPTPAEDTTKYEFDGGLPPMVSAIIDELASEPVIFVNRQLFDLTPYFFRKVEEDSLYFIDPAPAILKVDMPNYWPATRKMGHWNQHAHKALADWLSVEVEKYLKEEHSAQFSN